ncbi:MAG: 1-phosphofructokinase family hexose kinase [Hyphomicrobiaceae bacterium]
MTRTLTVTLNPALDITTSVERLVGGSKLRCRVPRVDAGGGGVNVSRAIAKLGEISLAFVALGGPVGETMKQLLEQEGIQCEYFKAEGNTRQSFVVHDEADAEQYRFILPGPCWSDARFEAFTDRLTQMTKSGDIVVLSGSMPPGVGKDAASRIVQLIENQDARVVADISGPALTALVHSGVNSSLTLIMNKNEAVRIAGEELDVRTAAAFMRPLVSRGAAETVIVTLGGDGAVAITADEAWHMVPPAMQVVSKVGAGDSFAAGLVIGLARAWPLSKALTYAMASAASAVTTPGTELCTKEGTESCLKDVVCTPLQ